MSLFYDIYFNGQRDGLLKIAREFLSRGVKEIKAYGPDAEFIKKVISNETGPEDPEIETLILYDRLNDLSTVLGRPKTYGGLLYEHNKPSTNDKIFEKIKGMDIQEAGNVLHEIVLQLQDAQKNRPKDIKVHWELAKLKQPLDHHVNELYQIKQLRIEEDLESMIYRKYPIEQVLRKLILEGECSNFYKQLIIQMYGFKYLFVLDEMERVGLFVRRQSKNIANIVNEFKEQKLTVFMIGGCTWDEYYYLSELGINVETDEMIGGNKFVNTFVTNILV